MQKLMLCTTSTKNSGKAEFLKSLISFFEKSKAVIFKSETDMYGDLHAVFSVRGKNVLIQTNGDDDESFKQIKRVASKYKAEVVICPTRTRGQEQYNILEKFAEKNGYKVLWFRHFFMEEHPGDCQVLLNKANEHLACAIFEFVKDYLNN